MGRRRQQRQEEREVFGRGGTATRYRMRQKLVAFGDDFWIENEAGQRAFKVDGKMVRVRDTLFFKTSTGRRCANSRNGWSASKTRRSLRDPTTSQLATVRKAIITPVRNRWTVKIGNGPDLDVQGNILSLEYTIGEGNSKIAEVSRKWFRVADTYGVQIDPGQNDIVILALTVAIDMMAHN